MRARRREEALRAEALDLAIEVRAVDAGGFMVVRHRGCSFVSVGRITRGDPDAVTVVVIDVRRCRSAGREGLADEIRVRPGQAGDAVEGHPAEADRDPEVHDLGGRLR
jgi:hypothetical protein